MLWRYFDIQIDPLTKARFRRHRLTRAVQVFQSNAPSGNTWNEPGYGWGRWQRV